MSTPRLNVEHETPLKTLHSRVEVMGTVVTIDVYDDVGICPSRLQPYLEAARAELQRADQTFSTWREDSPMSRLRRGNSLSTRRPPR